MEYSLSKEPLSVEREAGEDMSEDRWVFRSAAVASERGRRNGHSAYSLTPDSIIAPVPAMMNFQRGEKGEGFTETIKKDTWTKTREGVETGEGGEDGWGGGKGWGGKAENYT